MRKVKVFIVEYPEEDEKAMEAILEEALPPLVNAKINSIGEITCPYDGYYKPIDGIIDDLFLLYSKGKPALEEMADKIRAERCENVQKLLLGLNSKIDHDVAYQTVNHVKHCHSCQEFCMRKLNIGGNKDLEAYIAKRLQGDVES